MGVNTDMEQIYKEHAKGIYRYLLSLSHDKELAEELTQETLYRAVYSIDTYNVCLALPDSKAHLVSRTRQNEKKTDTGIAR